MRIGDCPTQDRERNVTRNIDVRYLNNLRTFTDRFKFSNSCNQQQCPTIRERLNQHQHEHHSSTFRTWDYNHHQHSYDQAIPASSDESKIKTSKDSRAKCNETEQINLNNAIHLSDQATRDDYERQSEERTDLCNNSSMNDDIPIVRTQTNKIDSHTRCDNYDSQFEEYSNLINDSSKNEYMPLKPIKAEYSSAHKSNYEQSDSINYLPGDNDIGLKQTQKRKVLLSKPTYYKENLQNEINEWLQDIPMYPSLSPPDKTQNQGTISNLIEKLYNLYLDVDGIDYIHGIKCEIDICMNKLQMWYPGSKRDQILFKDGLREDLLNKIKGLNDKIQININNYNNHEININIDNTANILGPKKEVNNKYFINENKECVANVINKWLVKVNLQQSDEFDQSINRKDITEVIMNRLTPLLNESMREWNYKLVLKSQIVGILHGLPICLNSPRFKNIYINRFAEELVNKLLSIQASYKNCKTLCCKHSDSHKTSIHANEVIGMPIPYTNIRHILKEKVCECLKLTKFGARNDTKEEITDCLLDHIEAFHSGDDQIVSAEVLNILLNSSDNITEAEATDITKHIFENVRHFIIQHKASNEEDLTRNLLKSSLSDTISVYTSEEIVCPSSCPVTSTPKKPVAKKVISKLNAEEIAYMKNLGKLINAWMETLPEKFDAPEEKDFKETVIKDLAGDLMDEAKLEQLAPGTRTDKEKYIKYIIRRWLLRLDVFDLEELDPQVQELSKRLKDIPVPTMTWPQHGGRQAMDNIKHMEGELGWKEYFVPKGLDILEDEISIWLNEQPSSIYVNNDRIVRNKLVHELAKILQDRLINKRSEAEISYDVKQWLNKIVKPEEKHNVVDLTYALKERVVNLPQDATLAANLEEKLRQRAEYPEVKNNLCCQPTSSNKIVTNDAANTTDPDRTMKEFIAKFIEHNYDIDDSMARGAFSHLLKTELQRLTPISRKEVYNKFSKSEPHDKFSPEKLEKELQYIKDISDWLKNIPINAEYNRVGNRQRVDFVNDLARNIFEVEEQRMKTPDAMDYNMYLASIMSSYTEQLPILPEHKCNIIYMIDQLIGKVIVHRKPAPRCQANEVNTSVNSSGLQDQNLSYFIDEYVRINGSEIAHDEIKLEAWSARLMKEIKKLVRDTADPSRLCKAEVYSKFANISIPDDESVRRFGLELEYVKEISEWLKNLPLLPISSQDGQETRIIMISELAEKMTEIESRKSANPSDTEVDRDFSNYVSRWISELPLDTNREVVLPIIVQQLKNRMEKVNKRSELSIWQALETHNRIKEPSKRKSHCQSLKSRKPLRNATDPEGLIVDAIEKWCNSLLVPGKTEEEIKITKDSIARKLFRKLCELNDDPSVFNDHHLYQDLLADEIELELDNLPQDTEIQNKRENLKSELLQTILEAKNLIKEKSAGDNYKQKLESTVEMSIPNPIHTKQQNNPGFDIYKNRLAAMFILENFDYGVDAVKMKYEKRIREEIDKYFEDAQKKNAVPLSKHQIYNELYSALFKVPVPNETSVIEEVEEVKTRCEIDVWFEDLPLREANGVGELLEWDKILSTLAKRIHEIEKAKCKPDEKIRKEITKWLLKLPLLPGNESNINSFAEKLLGILKSTVEARKCTISKSGKGTKEKVKASKPALRANQVTGSSIATEISVNQPAYQQHPCCQGSSVPQKKSADIILEIVEEWCNLLPLTANSSQEQLKVNFLREDLITKLVIKICELNIDPEIFDDNLLYDQLLDEELEKYMSNLPTCCEFQQSKAARKMQLRDAIQSIKPLIREERSRYEYKQELKNTVHTVLDEHHNTTAEKEALFNKLRDEIVDNFVQYNYNRDDDEGRQVYKMKVHDAVVKYVTDIVAKRNTKAPVDPLIRRNQLLCELAKIPVPSDAVVKDEVEEIRMKNEVSEFFDKLSFPKTDETKLIFRNQIKVTLSKRLNDIEKTGHICANESKMKNEIQRFLKKLDKEVKPDVIDAFINKLKNNELVRKAPPLRKPGYLEMSQSLAPQSLSLIDISSNQSSSPYRHYAGVCTAASPEIPSDGAGPWQNSIGPVHVSARVPGPSVHTSVGSTGQWISLLPGSPPKHESVFHSPLVLKEYRPSLGEVWSPYSHGGNRNSGQSAIDSQGFAGGVALQSSANKRFTTTKSTNQELSNRKSILKSPSMNSRRQSHLGNVQHTPSRYTAQSRQASSPAQITNSASPTPQVMPSSAHQDSTCKSRRSETIIRNRVEPNIFSQAPNHNNTDAQAPFAHVSSSQVIPISAILPQTNNNPQRTIRRPMAPTIPDGVQRSNPQVSSEDSDDEDRCCKCRRRRRVGKGKDFCVLPKRYCGGYNPFSCRMPCPGFFYYPNCF